MRKGDMKRRFLLPALLGIFGSILSASAIAASPQSVDIRLDHSDDFGAYAIEPIGNDQYCLAGDIYHDEVPNTSGFVMLVDASKRRVVWSLDIPYAKSNASNVALSCKSDGESLYVLSQEQTDSSPSVSQSELVLSKISASGKLLKRQRVSAGFDEWDYLLSVDANGISVAGGMNDALNRSGKFSVFMASFDKELKPQSVTTLPTGAFWVDTHARLEGQHLFMAGQFMANGSQGSSGHDGYAVSKVDLSKGGYVWSTYVYPRDLLRTKTAFLPDGRVAYVGLSASNRPPLLVSLIDSAGKLKKEGFTLSQPICDAKALAPNGSVLEIIGRSCSDEHSWFSVKIDLAAEKVIGNQRFDKDVDAVQAEGNAWLSVVGDIGAPKTFKRIAR